MVIEGARDGGGGDGGAGLGGVDVEAGVELAEVFLGGVEFFREDFDEGGVGHLLLFCLLGYFGRVGAGDGEVLGR